MAPKSRQRHTNQARQSFRSDRPGTHWARSSIHSRPRRTDSSSKLISNWIDKLEVFSVCIPRPPEITTRAAVSSGRSLLDSSAETKLDSSGKSPTLTVSVAALPPVGLDRVEAGGANGDDFLVSDDLT